MQLRPITRTDAALVFATIGAAVILSSCADDDEDASAGSPAPRIVEVTMTDHEFSPSSIQTEVGELVIFRFTNAGTTAHEAVIGDELFQMGHADHQHTPGMEMAFGAYLEPGERADVPYRFDFAGELIIGCHVDGHYDIGMKATVPVGDR